MGLDLTLYMKRLEDKTSEDIEMAYGRKTWDISNWFTERANELSDLEETYLITEETWNEFMNEFKPAIPRLKALILAAREAEENDDNDGYAIASAAVAGVLQFCYDMSDFYLGPVHEASILIDFYEADADIRNYWNEGYSLLLERSY